MAHTNQTEHYQLPQFIGTDKPSWLTDINNAFEEIDTAIYEASQSGGGGGGSVDPSELPIATKTRLGVVKIGDGLKVDQQGLLSADPESYIIPVASEGKIGGIKPSDSLQVAGDGTATVPTGSNTAKGLVQGGLNVTVNNGVLALNLIQGIPESGAVEGQLYYEVED